jgi:outer membrane usher protein
MGYLLGKEFYYIQPTYKIGILIPVKLISKVMVKGRLYTPDRKPVSLVVGDIFNGKGELVDNTFFTNKDGVFVIEGLEPGDYYIKTDRRHLGSIPLHVRTNEKNFLVIDSLVAPAAENGDSL